MLCCVCGAPGAALCGRCRSSLEPAGRRRIGSGLVVRSAWLHAGPARRMVHLLKYAGLASAARSLAEPMAALLDDGARVLVPIPRALGRLWRHGVDPARELAVALGRLTGLPVMAALHRPLHRPARAGSAPTPGAPPPFRLRRPVSGAVLVDDVVTTGSTLAAAHRALPGAAYALTATSALPERRGG